MQNSQDFSVEQPKASRGQLRARESFALGDYVMGIHYPTQNIGDPGELVEGIIEMISHHEHDFYNEDYTGITWPCLTYLVGGRYLTSKEILPFDQALFDEVQFLFAQRKELLQVSENITQKLKTKMRVPQSNEPRRYPSPAKP